MMSRIALRGGLLVVAVLPLLSAGCCCCSSFNKGFQQGLQQAVQKQAEEQQKMIEEGQTTTDLAQIASAYRQYCNANPGKAPANVDQLKPYLPGGDNIIQSVRSGKYQVYWNVNLNNQGKNPPGAGGSAVLAYQQNTPTQGGMVVMTDGTTKRMTAADFSTARKAR